MNTQRIILTFGLLFMAVLSFGQTANREQNAWKTLQTVDGIKVEYRKGECNVPSKGSYTEEVYLKFTNTTDVLSLVQWTFDMTYGDECFNCEGTHEEMIQSIKLAPMQSREGQCGDDNDLRLRIFSKFLKMENPSVLTDFHVKILSISELDPE